MKCHTCQKKTKVEETRVVAENPRWTKRRRVCKHCGFTLWTVEMPAEDVVVKEERTMDETPPCKADPRAPHGFDRNASHNADRYVCECEGWEPPKREWVGLDKEAMRNTTLEFNQGALWAERYLKEKNT